MVCWSNKAVAPHPTISAVPLPDATLARLISIYVILQFIEFARTCRPDKAFTPHPA
ncbi:TPA: hypothetical protein ACWQ0C_003855 [Escherichia coli]